MHIRSNLHTHTTFCDGKNTPEENVQAAIRLGFTAIGFSGHAYEGPDMHWTMDPGRSMQYFSELERLKTVYSGKLQIYAGLETDPIWPSDTSLCDFVIGSSHYFKAGNTLVSADGHADTVSKAIQEHFSGNGMQMVLSYYERLVSCAESGSLDILGHFDVLTKFNRGNCLFDADSSRYRSIALDAADAISKTGVIVEVNTGGMARGYTDVPYPAPFLLKRFLANKTPVIISSDAHAAASLASLFEETEDLLREIGYREVMELTPTGFQPTSLL